MNTKTPRLIKQGIAVTAISALATATLATTAVAQPISDEYAAGTVGLITAQTSAASVKNDGTNTTIHLVAGAASDVVQVRFEYRIGADWVAIDTVEKTNGAFATEWSPPTPTLGGSFDIRVIGLDNTGADIPGAVDTATAVVAGGASQAVNISQAPGSSLGLFEQPYAAAGSKTLGRVQGVTTDVGNNPSVDVSSPSGADVLTPADVYGEPQNGTRTFSGAADFTGYTWDNTAPIVDEAFIYAADESDDAEPVTVYKQTISTVNAVATNTLVQTGDTTSVTVSVLDQNNQPVVGARVYTDSTDADAATKFTNSQGQATFTGFTGSQAGKTHTFHVDTTQDAAYNPGTDFQRQVTVTEYTPELQSLALSSKDGSAFDRDEYNAGDIVVKATDQNNNPTEPGNLQGQWTVTTFPNSNGETTTTTYPATVDPVTGEVGLPAGAPDGTWVLNVWKENNGTPGQQAADLSASPLTLKVGEAEIVWVDDDNYIQAPSGSASVFVGKVQLADGTVLPGREVAIDLDNGLTGDSVIANNQPAGTTKTSDTTATAVSAADGTIRVNVNDPAVTTGTQPSELGVILDGAATSLGLAKADVDDLVIDFVNVTPNTVTFSAPTYLYDNDNDAATAPVATPGRPVSYEVTVNNSDGDPLADSEVTLTLDHGYFTTYAASSGQLKPAGTVGEGDEVGSWVNEGSTKTFTTDNDGKIQFTVAIGRDEGFDDDGKVTANITAVSGNINKTQQLVFSSQDALNPGDVTIAAAEDNAASLPQARVGSKVWFDVVATDQFGNRTQAQVNISDNDANDAASFTPTTVTSQFTQDDPAVQATSTAAVQQTLTATWDNAPTTTWTDTDQSTAGFQAGVTTGQTDLTDNSETIDWYEVDYAQSDLTLTSNSDGVNPVGSVVTVTYTALDQTGEPLQGVNIRFFRGGEQVASKITDAQGQAPFAFQGAEEGEETVTAMVYTNDTSNGDPVVGTSRSVTVRFGEEPGTDPGEKIDIFPQIKGWNKNRNDKDVVRVIVDNPAANGATVRLYRTVNRSERVLVSRKSLVDGKAKFWVADPNPNSRNRYYAVVSGTNETNRARTPGQYIR